MRTTPFGPMLGTTTPMSLRPQVAGPQMPPFMSTTPFGPILGATTQMTPELLALYNGEITPGEYRLLTDTRSSGGGGGGLMLPMLPY